MGISASDVKALRERTNAPMMECKKALTEADGDVEAAIKVLRERGIAKAAKRAGRETAEGVVRVKVADDGTGAAIMLSCETDFSARNDEFIGLADKVLEAAMSLAPGEASAEAVLNVEVGGQTIGTLLDDIANKIRENMKVAKVVRFGGNCSAYVHHDGRKGALLEVEAGDASKMGDLADILRNVCMHIVATVPPPLAVDASDISEEMKQAEREIFVKQAVDSGKPQEIAEKMVEGRMKKFVAERALVEQAYVMSPDKSVQAAVEEAAKAAGTTLKIVRFERMAIGE